MKVHIHWLSRGIDSKVSSGKQLRWPGGAVLDTRMWLGKWCSCRDSNPRRQVSGRQTRGQGHAHNPTPDYPLTKNLKLIFKRAMWARRYYWVKGGCLTSLLPGREVIRDLPTQVAQWGRGLSLLVWTAHAYWQPTPGKVLHILWLLLTTNSFR